MSGTRYHLGEDIFALLRIMSLTIDASNRRPRDSRQTQQEFRDHKLRNETSNYEQLTNPECTLKHFSEGLREPAHKDPKLKMHMKKAGGGGKGNGPNLRNWPTRDISSTETLGGTSCFDFVIPKTTYQKQTYIVTFASELPIYDSSTTVTSDLMPLLRRLAP
jgi:hypothetical protein